MSRSRRQLILATALLALASPLHAQTYKLGRPATAEEIAGWDIDVRPDGRGLPPGRGTAALGKNLYVEKCGACHGEKGEGKLANQLVGGQGTLHTDKPIMTIGSYWPYATTVFDYIKRSMPFAEPQSLKADEIYAITAYLLFLDGIIGETDVMTEATLPKVQMPNRNGFVSDPRPDIKSEPCQVNCR